MAECLSLCVCVCPSKLQSGPTLSPPPPQKKEEKKRSVLGMQEKVLAATKLSLQEESWCVPGLASLAGKWLSCPMLTFQVKRSSLPSTQQKRKEGGKIPSKAS